MHKAAQDLLGAAKAHLQPQGIALSVQTHMIIGLVTAPADTHGEATLSPPPRLLSAPPSI